MEAEDAGNAIFEFGRRYLVPNSLALVLQDAYNYSIAMPETFGTFHASLDASAGHRRVAGPRCSCA